MSLINAPALQRDSGQRYLDLLEQTLTHALWPETLEPYEMKPSPGLRGLVKRSVGALLAARGLELVRRVTPDPAIRGSGRDQPRIAHTMVGLKRLRNLRECVEIVLRDSVPGDLIETGIWRGGSIILMRAVLAVHGVTDRRVWAADSFEGLPPPDPRYPADAASDWHLYPHLRVSLDQVRENLAAYGLLDDQVRFLKGWFKDTLRVAPIEQLAVLRLDGDLYESTMDALAPLYPKVALGGFVIVDDYGIPQPGCREAVEDFRAQHGITDPVQDIDGWGAFWRRTR